MFEPPVVETADTVELADRLDASVEEPQVDPPWTRHRRRTSTVRRCYGAEGTPAVSEYAAMELDLTAHTPGRSVQVPDRPLKQVRPERGSSIRLRARSAARAGTWNCLRRRSERGW